MGRHQGQPAGGTKNLSNSGDTPQVETISINPGPFIQSTTESGRYRTIGQLNDRTNSPQGRNRLTQSFPHLYHSCLCGGRGGRTHLHGQMGRNKAPNGIFLMLYPSTPENQFTLWYPPHFKWDGWNHPHSSARLRKQQETLHRAIVKLNLAPCPRTNSPTT